MQETTETAENTNQHLMTPGMSAIITEHNESTAVGHSGISKSMVDQIIEQVFFDGNAKQIATFKKVDGDGDDNVLVFAIAGLHDESLAQFDRLTVSKQRLSGDIILLENDDLAACKWFFKNEVMLVDGFEGDLPSNWHDEFEPGEQQAVVRQFVSAFALPEVRTNITKKMVFGQKKAEKTIRIRSTYNDKQTTTLHTLPKGYLSFIGEFAEIVGVNEIVRGEESLNSPSVMEKLGELYDKVKVKSDDYENGFVPVNHKAAVMRDAFTSTLQKQQKK